MMYYDVNDDYAEERSAGRRRFYGNCGGPTSYHGACGAPDCSSCRNGSDDEESEPEEMTATTARYTIAHKDYGTKIKKGDVIRTVSGFFYEEGGKRLGYMRPVHHFVAAPPGDSRHVPSEWARGILMRNIGKKNKI